MSIREQVLLFKPVQATSCYDFIGQQFETTCVTSVEAAVSLAKENDYKAIVCDLSQSEPFDITVCEGMFSSESDERDMPVLVLSSSDELDDKLITFEAGADDYIAPNTPPEEVCVRIRKAIFHQVASEQLKDRLNLANKTAFSVMSDNSDLGSNIQFLLQIHQCDNLDQLGQMFFRILSKYDISCSLQMRSIYNVKNMEASGMEKDLESQLLFQMKDGGRYIDFGRRTIVNYGRVSLLIRDMPLNDDRRYGAIKDNTFSLIQGVDARVKALDEHLKLQEEKNSLHKLSQDVKSAMSDIDQSYQEVMRNIADVVEDMAEQIDGRIPALALSEEQERFFETVVQNCVMETSRVFNDGLKVDQFFKSLSDSMDQALQDLSEDDSDLISEDPLSSDQIGGDDIELF